MLQENTIAPPSSDKLQYQGMGGNLFGLILKNLFLTIITLGIYHAWGKTNVIKYHFQNTLFRDKPFTFYGTGRERFFGMLKVLLVYALVLATSFLFVSIFENLSPNNSYKFLDLFGLLTQIILLIVLFFGLPFIIVSSRKYRTSRTVWESISFSYKDKYACFFKFYYVQWLLTIITFGIYTPNRTINHANWFYSRLSFGNIQFNFVGNITEYRPIFWKNFFLTIITFGLWSFKAAAAKTNYIFYNVVLTQKINGIQYEGKLNSFYTAWDLFVVYFVSIFGFVITLGLAGPWIMTYTMRYFLESIVVENNIQWHLVKQETSDWNASTGEVLAEDYGLDIGAI